MSEPGRLLSQPQSERQKSLWQHAPGFRNLTAAASLLTLAAVATPLLLPQPVDTGFSPAPKAASLKPQTHAPAMAAQPLSQQPAPIPSDLPLGTLVVPSGERMKVNQHNRNSQGHDWPITISIITPPQHGKVSTAHGRALIRFANQGMERNSAVTQIFYQSADGYSGLDSFTYRRTSADPQDGRNLNTYTVNVYVSPEGSSAQRSPSPGNRGVGGPLPQQATPLAQTAALQPSAGSLGTQVVTGTPSTNACAIKFPTQARPMGGAVVTGFMNPMSAQQRLRQNEQALGGTINPAFAATSRVTVRADDGGLQLVVLPPGMQVQVGDRITFNSKYRDVSMPCGYVPPLVTADNGPAERRVDQPAPADKR